MEWHGQQRCGTRPPRAGRASTPARPHRLTFMSEWPPQPEPSSSTTGLSACRRSVSPPPMPTSLSKAFVVGSSLMPRRTWEAMSETESAAWSLGEQDGAGRTRRGRKGWGCRAAGRAGVGVQARVLPGEGTASPVSEPSLHATPPTHPPGNLQERPLLRPVQELRPVLQLSPQRQHVHLCQAHPARLQPPALLLGRGAVGSRRCRRPHRRHVELRKVWAAAVAIAVAAGLRRRGCWVQGVQVCQAVVAGGGLGGGARRQSSRTQLRNESAAVITLPLLDGASTRSLRSWARTRDGPTLRRLPHSGLRTASGCSASPCCNLAEARPPRKCGSPRAVSMVRVAPVVPGCWPECCPNVLHELQSWVMKTIG